jgi:TrmH family RNA methyltransferase
VVPATVLLDDPRNSKNLGAVIRVGAGVGAAGVLVHGSANLCDPAAVRGAAGLQWALPGWGSPTLLAELDDVRARTPIALVGLDADAPTFDPAAFTTPTIFAFGSERTGLSEAVRTRCDAVVSLPMAAHVSSLNLATAVSAVLYLRLYAG